MTKPTTALISVSDKTGILPLAQTFTRLGIEILSTGGTAKTLREAKIPVTDISDYTGHDEILGGRVKTLHPAVHAGILFRRNNPDDVGDMFDNSYQPIDIVVCNLYPFAETIAGESTTKPEAIERIDIGGVTLLRAAAKNHEFVTVVPTPDDYAVVTSELLASGEICDAHREFLAMKAFCLTAEYDATIANYFEINCE